MELELFKDVVEPTVRVGERRWFSVPLTIAGHGAIVAVVILVHAVAPGMLPALPTVLAFSALIEAPGPPPGPPPAPRPSSPAKVPRANPDAAPVVAPTGVARETGIVHEPEPVAAVEVAGGLTGGAEGLGLKVLPEAPPPPPPPPAPTAPMRVGGNVRPPTKLKDVAPDYPDFALKAQVHGTVIIEATIDASGHVADVRVLRSVSLLDQAALAAVRQWVYTPTLYNGVAVPVIMTVTVNFSLR